MSETTLTHEQLKIVYSNCRINAAMCCPGSGKTTVLTKRAERLWEDTNEPILVCTFSNKAVKDITKKLNPEYNSFIKVQTIHSLCYSVVKDYWNVVGEIIGGEEWPQQPQIVDKMGELELIQQFFPNKDYVKLYDKFEELRAFNSSPAHILRLTKKGVYFGKFSLPEIELWDKYEKYRLSKGLINFDDMTGLAAAVMPLPEVSVGVSKKYRHLLIDEAQDTSESQWTVLRPLVAHASTTLVVGDINQSIYGWRNADGSVLSGLGYLQDAVVFRLTESFRSGSLVAKFANLIVRDKSSQIKTKDGVSPFSIKELPSKEEEVSYILNKVDSDSAVLSRTNSYLEPFERMCIKNNIPYTGSAFYRSPHIKSAWKMLQNFKGEDINELITRAFVENVTYTKSEHEDFRMLLSIIKKEGLESFLQLSEMSNAMNEDGGVTLTTGHAAKGLQWPKVFVVGAQEGHTPHKLSTDDDEERNLFYVMCTREAGQGLEITYVGDPSRYIKDYLNFS